MNKNKRKKPTECIRILADVEQINNCKKVIRQKELQIADIAAAMNLAGNEVRLNILYLIYKEKRLCV